jgi:hypothetical protein
MLTFDELLGQVKQLSSKERLALFEATAQMIKEDQRLQNGDLKPSAMSTTSPANDSGPEKYTPFIREEWLYLDEEALKAQGFELRGTPVENVLGIAWAAENGAPSTDEEIKEDYINYLAEKYS